jgi:hypothetical protein
VKRWCAKLKDDWHDRLLRARILRHHQAGDLLLNKLTVNMSMDNMALCMACSSSLPPVRSPASNFSSPSSPRLDIFKTRCCSQPICPTCLTANPRLARYDPCLHCLGGVAILAGKRSAGKHEKLVPLKNVDGALMDEDAFVVGDDDDEENDLDENQLEVPMEYSGSDRNSNLPAQPSIEDPTVNLSGSKADLPTEDPLDSEVSSPRQYHVQLKDTLQGIALRFGVSVSERRYSPTIYSILLRSITGS